MLIYIHVCIFFEPQRFLIKTTVAEVFRHLQKFSSSLSTVKEPLGWGSNSIAYGKGERQICIGGGGKPSKGGHKIFLSPINFWSNKIEGFRNFKVRLI